MGVFAGAMTTLDTGMAAGRSARPDFIAPIYPPMMARTVPGDAPLMFPAIALDDPLFTTGQNLGLTQPWRDAKPPLGVHLYEKGAMASG